MFENVCIDDGVDYRKLYQSLLHLTDLVWKDENNLKFFNDLKVLYCMCYVIVIVIRKSFFSFDNDMKS